MRTTLTLLLAILVSAAPALDAQAEDTGAIAGTVTVADDAQLRDVVVFVLGMDLERTPSPAAAIDQSNKTFVPSLLVVPVGTTIEFPNNDVVAHNVWSNSSAASFDLGLYGGGKSRSHVMEQAGVVEVFCNVHPSMAAAVLVVENDFYAAPSSTGHYEIDGLPPGTYEVLAWMAFGDAVERTTITVQAGETTTFEPDLSSVVQSKKHLNKHGEAYSPYP